MIRVGIVGASGWANASHLPALAGLDEYAVTAVATTRRASAEAVAAAHGVPHALTDAAALVAHPEVDLVVVSVRAAGHAAVVRAALAAGKDVLSEWPLGVDAAEAEDLARAAEAAGVRHAVNLQGHWSPDARFLADLLAAGRIGRLEAAVLVAAGDPLGGARIAPELEWSTDPAGGTSLLTVMAGHFLAVLHRVAGPLVEVSARLPGAREHVEVTGTGRTVPNGVPAHLMLLGTLENGAAASVTVHGGSGTPDGFLLRLVGSAGTLTAIPATPGSYPHWTDWEIRLDGEPLEVPADYRTVPFHPADGPVANVAALYREFAEAAAANRPPHPDFRTAAAHHRLLAAVERSAATGTPQEV
ncbi:oxidoreductase [Kitasatospora phosalacinea]|uniref:Oxidoreductase n=1 Tax=Kitasatospora phosalacinea TaxID=2065 RepID=A0A9W6QBK2_9ACTN|nr:Gfo/Idh/MocA family oxidoreductase [Kitasatospora phosalacinea]GLW72054.1 oxidoreductase [Kitasatospora phosalacinea]